MCRLSTRSRSLVLVTIIPGGDGDIDMEEPTAVYDGLSLPC